MKSVNVGILMLPMFKNSINSPSNKIIILLNFSKLKNIVKKKLQIKF